MAQVFISYRRVESSMLATLIARELEAKGFTVFVDTRSVDGAGPFPERLRAAIADCSVFVCLLGASSLSSAWVREEIAQAQQLGKKLIPVFQEKYTPPDPVPDDNVRALLQSDGIHVLDVKNIYVEEAISRLATMIQASIGQRQPAAGSRTSRKAIFGVGLLLILAALLLAIVPSILNPATPTPAAPTEPIIAPASDTPAVPISDFTPSFTATPDGLAQALAQASFSVITSAEWQEHYPTGFVQMFDGVAMVLVPAGCFEMGDGGTGGQQCFDAPFWIDQYEVSNEQFARLGGSAGRDSQWTEPLRPRENVTWFEARDFCQQRAMRLPTEREWEYAARGADGLVYPWGNDFVAQNAHFEGNTSSQTANVDQFASGASWVGAVQMSGNVWEWTATWNAAYPYDANDGREDPADASSDPNLTARVLRGGAWSDSAEIVRGAYRNSSLPDQFGAYTGIRCAMSV